MQSRKVYGKWQKRVQKVLLKRCLRDRQKTNGEENAAAKTARQQKIPAETTQQR
ncbi:MAG: hypothetical protein J6L00_02320 [Clostridia bacterium]|nr:hypothetical protein [Clostridia bacterium]